MWSLAQHPIVEAALAVISGELAHRFIWIRGEWDAAIGRIVFGCVLVNAVLSFILTSGPFLDTAHHQPGQEETQQLRCLITYRHILYLEVLHLCGTFASIAIYRLFQHPLTKFPGPVGAKLWIWWRVWKTFESGERQAVVMDKVHKEYGDIVRVGPNHLSIRLVSAVSVIHGPGPMSRSPKPASYLNPANSGSVNAERDPHIHDLHRRKWDRALAPRATLPYLAPIQRHTHTLISRLSRHHGRPLICNEEIHLLFFDILGSVGFGRENGFSQLETGVLHPAIKHLLSMMRIGVYMMIFPWLHCLLGDIPSFGVIYKPEEEFREFAGRALEEKRRRVSEEKSISEGKNGGDHGTSHGGKDERDEAAVPMFKDIISHLLAPDPTSITLTDRQLISDAVILSIAGTDTSTSVTIHMLYRLARHPEIQSLLYTEVSAVFPDDPVIPVPWSAIAHLPYLEAFVNETLRLHPPAASGTYRWTPPEGIKVQGDDGTLVHIPGGVNVSTPVYSLHRDGRYFVAPEEFVPERWIATGLPASLASLVEAKPHMVLDRRAFLPFFGGTYGCAGKGFAYMEMKTVLVELVRAFTVAFKEGAVVAEIDRTMREEWRDYSTVRAADLEVRFIKR